MCQEPVPRIGVIYGANFETFGNVTEEVPAKTGGKSALG